MNKYLKIIIAIFLSIFGLLSAGCSDDLTPTTDITDDEVVDQAVFDENELNTQVDDLI